jgi:hypothetical protein
LVFVRASTTSLAAAALAAALATLIAAALAALATLIAAALAALAAAALAAALTAAAALAAAALAAAFAAALTAGTCGLIHWIRPVTLGHHRSLRDGKGRDVPSGERWFPVVVPFKPDRRVR